MRNTGGNRFIEADSDKTILVAAIQRGINELVDWAAETGRRFDPGAVSVETRRIKSGRISVSVEGDLDSPTPAHPGDHTTPGDGQTRSTR